FRDFLRQHGRTPEEQELIAAKLMGRWRSGAPLVLAPNKDDPALGADMRRNNDFNYKEMDPHGYAVPLGSHCRRMNPRDTAANMNRRRMIRRGATYGPPLPEGIPDDGAERGIAAFVICASLIRQFEFAQNVWANDKNFHELENERDPIIVSQDGTLDYTIPRRHTPGNRRFSIYISWSYPGEANRDVTELDNRFSTMVEVRRVGWPAFEAARFADPLLFQRGIAGSLELFFLSWIPFQQLVGEVTGHPVAVYQR